MKDYIFTYWYLFFEIICNRLSMCRVLSAKLTDNWLEAWCSISSFWWNQKKNYDGISLNLINKIGILQVIEWDSLCILASIHWPCSEWKLCSSSKLVPSQNLTPFTWTCISLYFRAHRSHTNQPLPYALMLSNTSDNFTIFTEAN